MAVLKFLGRKTSAPPVEEAFVALEDILTRTAIGAARTSVRLSSAGEAHGRLEASAQLIQTATEQLRQNIESAAESAGKTAGASRQMAQLTREGRSVAEQSVGSVHDLREQTRQTGERLAMLLQKIESVTSISKLIEDIAGRTNLLALNAAIEAARAGAAGKGFAVVADEVRKLAKSTAEQTRQIDTLVSSIAAELGPARAAMQQSVDLAGTTAGHVEAVGEQLARIHELAEGTSSHVDVIAASLQEQSKAVGTVVEGAQSSVANIQAVRRETEQIASEALAVSAQTEAGYRALAPHDTGTLFHRARNLAREFSLRVQQIIEEPVLRGQCSLDQLLALQYREIKGDRIRSLARVFDVSRVPSSGFTPPKFETAYDALVDEALQEALEAILARESRLVFSFLMDLNTYTPAHNRQYTKAWTGVPEKDLPGNRTKRFFDGNRVPVRAARVGLGQAADDLPLRSPREAFQRAGCELREVPGARDAFVVQTYPRDTGALVTALTVPVFACGYRFGGLILGWTEDGSR